MAGPRQRDFMVVKTAQEWLGPGEGVLRVPSFVASLLALGLYGVLVLRVLAFRHPLLALAVVTLAEPLIGYTASVKQYECDVLVTVVLLLAFCRRRGNNRAKRMAILGMLGAMAVWCSHPAIFILGGIGLTLVLSNLCAGQWRRSMAWSLTMACCATSFAIAYLSVYQHAHSDYLLNYWKDTFARSHRARSGT